MLDCRGTAGLDGAVLEEVLKVLLQLGGGLIAVRRLFGDGLQDDDLQVIGDLGSELSRRCGGTVSDLVDQAAAAAVSVGRPQRQHLVEGEAQAVDVAAGVVGAPELLRRHVLQRADDIAAVGQVRLLHRLGQAEVRDPHHAVGVQDQVGGLDVPVQGALAVGIVQGVGHLHAYLRDAAPVAAVAGHGQVAVGLVVLAIAVGAGTGSRVGISIGVGGGGGPQHRRGRQRSRLRGGGCRFLPPLEASASQRAYRLARHQRQGTALGHVGAGSARRLAVVREVPAA